MKIVEVLTSLEPSAQTGSDRMAKSCGGLFRHGVAADWIAKRAISLRVDEDVLAWFKAAGPRYQSRMNAVLRSYVMHVRGQRRRKGAA